MNSRKAFSKKLAWPVAILSLVTAGLLAGATRGDAAAAPQESAGRCTISAPNEWGDYLDSGSYGVVFRDNNGTLRFINRFPCGLDGAPNVALEIRRK